MKKTSIAFSIVLIASVAPADWSGNWNGSGKTVMQPGSASAKTRHCQQISIDFQQTSKTLNLVSGGYTCEDLDANYDAAQFTIQGQQLVIGSQNYGDISDQKLDLVETDPDDGSLFHLTLTKNPDGSISYNEQWSQGSTIEMTVQGQLKK